MQTYFVTGATGFIGRHLVERLLQRDGDIYVLVREESQDKLNDLVQKWGHEDRIKPVASIFTPIFFVTVGSSVDLRLLDPTRPGASGVLWAAFVITILAILGKVVAGWAAPWAKFRRLVVGVGMIPRGEVGLIFADIGRRSGVLGAEVFNAVLLMVLITTFLAPVLLKKIVGPAPVPAK